MNKRTAKKGMWLTQANLPEGEERLFLRKVAGFADLNELFTEWTDEQKREWEAEEHPIDEEISDAEALEIITGK